MGLKMETVKTVCRASLKQKKESLNVNHKFVFKKITSRTRKKNAGDDVLRLSFRKHRVRLTPQKHLGKLAKTYANGRDSQTSV